MLADKYRPRSLADIVGQPAPVRFMQRLVAKPERCCLLLESEHGGTGKTACAQALAAELGAVDEFTGLWRFSCAKFDMDTASAFFGRTCRLRWDNPHGFTVLVIEEMDWLSPQVQRLAKDALDPLGSMPERLIVVATSNGAGGLLPALLQRFRIFGFSSGPTFASACHDRLASIWQAECGSREMPTGWLESWGWRGSKFSMRLALQALEDAIDSAASVAA